MTNERLTDKRLTDGHLTGQTFHGQSLTDGHQTGQTSFDIHANRLKVKLCLLFINAFFRFYLLC